MHGWAFWLSSNSLGYLVTKQKCKNMARRVDSIKEEIQELKKKLTLLDGDKRAYFENTQFEMEKNRSRIQQLRQENKQLRAQLAKKMVADDDVITEAFKRHNMKPPAELRGLPGDSAARKFDQSVCEMIKKRNALQHIARNRQKQLESILRQLAHMEKESQAIMATPSGESTEAKKLKELENRLDHTIIQCNEANHIRNIYENILDKLQQERLNYDNEIAALEQAINIRKKNLKDLQNMHYNAEGAKDMAKTELQHQELNVAENKKKREKELESYRKKAEEKKEFAEKVEKRVQLRRMSVGQDSMGQLSEGEEDQSLQEEHEAKISSYEEAFAKIKDATGVSDIQEVVDRFLNQRETRQHLEHLREEHSQQLARLKEDKDKLQVQFEEMKYSGEARMSSGQRMLEDVQNHLEEANERCKESEVKTDRACRLLGQVKTGVEHLSIKLQHIKSPHTHILKPHLEPGSEEAVLELLNDCEQKLVSLVEELGSRDLDTIQREMEDEEFRQTIEGEASTNIRITLPKELSSQDNLYDESDDDDEFAVREEMKQATQQLVEAKTKKKPQDDDEDEEGKGKKRRR